MVIYDVLGKEYIGVLCADFASQIILKWKLKNKVKPMCWVLNKLL